MPDAHERSAPANLMHHRPKGLLTNALWSSGYVVSTMVLSFLVTPMLIHHLGKSLYGLLLLIWSVAGILGTMNLGLGEATLRYVARYADRQDMAGVNRVFGAVLSLFTVVCAIILVGMFVGAPLVAAWLNAPADQIEMVSWLLRLTALSITFSIIMSVFGAVPLALQRYDINSKITMGSNVVRSAGYIALAAGGMNLVSIVVWDLVVSLAVFCLIVKAAKDLLPGLKLLPAFSFNGLREVIGYSTFSFLTFFLHKWHRESGKLMLARFMGPVPVVYLATPDNLAQRFHEVIAGGIEAALPRFSAESQQETIERLYWSTTWTGLALSIVVFVPFVALVPNFLSLWISADFAAHSGLIGQLLAVYLISQGGFSAPAAYFRGTGRPWFVTCIILLSLLITVAAGVVLIPLHGPLGAAYAYLAGSIAPFIGMTAGSIYAFGARAIPKMLRTIGTTLVSAAIAGVLCLYAGKAVGEMTWLSLVCFGAVSMIVTAALVFGADALLGGEQPTSVQLLRRLVERLRHKGSNIAGAPTPDIP
jgi:O-antigen/teichoic acid export membrane protein